MQQDQAVSEPASWQAFHGVNGELVGAHHDEDGVMIRADFHGSKLSAATARELAGHLSACADLADDWMASMAADAVGGPAEPADRCGHGLEPYRCILTAGHPGVHDPGPDPDGHGPDCQCRYCLNGEGVSEYRHHEPEPWQ
jgi:hypothetical protein